MNNKHLEPLGSGIKIYVSDSYRFSTDTILLADFSKQIGAKKCVDLGTGCGTIPLLWYKNNNRLDITAVEIQENACKLFSQSLEYNNLQDKIRIVCPKDNAQWILLTGQPTAVANVQPKTYLYNYDPSGKILNIYY